MLDTETYPVLEEKKDGWDYIKPTMAWRKGETPDATELERELVIEALRKANADIPKDDFQRAQEWIWPRLANPALTRFMSEQGAHSRFFVPWLMSIPTAKSMEPGCGYGYDMTGRCQPIPKTDPFYMWVIRSPFFVSYRSRTFFAANLLMEAENAAVLACGDGAEVTRTGFRFRPGEQQIYMCDIDPDIDLRKKLGCPLEFVGIHYQQMDLREFVRQERFREFFDLVILNGLMSYLGPIEPVLTDILSAVKRGGKIEFDLQLEHWELIRAVTMFGWPAGNGEAQIELTKDGPEAVRKVEQACQDLDVAISAYPDLKNPQPTSVIFVIKKL